MRVACVPRSRLSLPLLALACATTQGVGCRMFGGSGETGGAPASTDAGGTSAADAGARETTVPAGDMAARFGVASYAIITPGEAETMLSVGVRGAGGATLGTLTVAPDSDSGYLVTYTTYSGAIATVETDVTIDDDAGTYFVRREVTANGTTLANVTVADLATGASRESWLEAPLAPDATPPTVGAFAVTSDGEVAVLVVDDAGSDVADPNLLERWATDVGVTGLLKNPAVPFALAVADDPALVDAVDAAVDRLEPAADGEAPPGAMAQALTHESPECRGLRARVHELDADCCRECAEADPDPMAAVPAGISGGMAELLYAVPCQCCMRVAGVKMADAMRCVRAWRRSKDIYDDARCMKQNPPSMGRVSVASDDGHSCTTKCDAAACSAACMTIPGVSESRCSGDTCQCKTDADAYCRGKIPATYCGDGTRLWGFSVECPRAECGDGIVMSTCAVHPELNEVCDTNARPDGCAVDSGCSACTQCVPCTCKADADCSGGEACVKACQCVKLPTCGDNAADFFTALAASERWCDPGASDAATGANSFCAMGETCNAGTCRCQASVAKLCPNGVVDADMGEECDPNAPRERWTCAADEDCADCRCLTAAGTCVENGVIDRGEECDPTADGATWNCEAGVNECFGCRCTPKCGNGKLDNTTADFGPGFETCEPSAGVDCAFPAMHECDPKTCGCKCKDFGTIMRDPWGAPCIPGLFETKPECAGDDRICVQVACPPNSTPTCFGCECVANASGSTSDGCPAEDGGWLFGGVLVECHVN